MKKAFIHIVEIVVISLVVFFVILQFSVLPKIEKDWSRTKLVLQGNDILFTLNKQGIDWSDSAKVKGEFSKLLRPNVAYDLKVIDQTSTTTVVSGSVQNPVRVSIFNADNRTGTYRVYEVILSLGYLF